MSELTPEKKTGPTSEEKKEPDLQAGDLAQMDSRITNGVGDVQRAALRADFSLWSTLGIGFSYIATPLSIGTFMAFSLSAGGSPYFFYGYVACMVFNTLVVMSLAEIAAFAPHTSGQIYWTAKVAPTSYSRTLSYFTGAFTMMAWTFWTSATLLFAAQLLLAFLAICGTTFTQQPYQVFLIYVAFDVYAVLINTIGYKGMPALAKIMLVYINLGSIFVLITLLVRATPKPSASQVFVDVVNETGWSSNGLVFFLALLPGLTALNGFDSAAHMAEELPHPAKQVPQIMFGLVLLCGLTGLPMVIVFLFSITNPANLLTTSQPIFQLFLDSMRCMPLTIIACLIYLGLFLFACGSITTTLSRVWWAFSRTGALPFARWQGHVSEDLTVPVHAILVVASLQVLIGLLVLGPSTVLYGLTGAAAICFFISYIIPIVCFLIRGRSNLPKDRYFNLGPRLGPIINIISVAWASMVSVFLCFPVYHPVTSLTMNYASAVIGVGILLFGLLWIFHAHKHYVVPAELYSEELHGSEELVFGTGHSKGC